MAKAEGIVVTLQHKKLAIMAGLPTLEKDGQNRAQNYDYVSEAQVVALLRAAMVKHGLTVTPSIPDAPILQDVKSKEGKVGCSATLRLDLTLHDTESGESETSSSWGQGVDYGDKAVAKAITMANKYALLKLFMLSTEDAEADESVDADPPASREEPKGTPPSEDKALAFAVAKVRDHPAAAALAKRLGLSTKAVKERYDEAGGDMMKLVLILQEEAGKQ